MKTALQRIALLTTLFVALLWSAPAMMHAAGTFVNGFLREADGSLDVAVVQAAPSATPTMSSGFSRYPDGSLAVTCTTGCAGTPVPCPTASTGISITGTAMPACTFAATASTPAPTPTPPTIVQTAQGANATNTTSTATFSVAPANGDLILGLASIQGTSCTQNGPSYSGFATGGIVNSQAAGASDSACLLIGRGDGVTTAYSFTGTANGANLFVFDISGENNYGFVDAYIAAQNSPLHLPPIYAPANSIVAYGIPFDNSVPVITPPAGWTAVVVGGQHAIGVLYRTITTPGRQNPSATSTNTTNARDNTIGVWVY